MIANNKDIENAKGLEVGAKAPAFTTVDHNGKEFSLKTAIRKGPVVLIFYRGHWCPICNRHLSHLQDSLEIIKNFGATAVAISPEKTEFLNLTKQKTEADFRLLHDKDYKISEAYDVAFKPDNQTIKKYNKHLNADLENAHSESSTTLLPIPATYIINSSGKIIWRHFDPNYKNRSSMKNIINQIK